MLFGIDILLMWFGCFCLGLFMFEGQVFSGGVVIERLLEWQNLARLCNRFSFV